MRVLVTGGAGFIGSHLVDELLVHGYEVRVLDSLVRQVHPRGERPAYLSDQAELFVGDVRDPYLVRRVLKDVDAVCHLAARVGVGQSMYEFCEYVHANSFGTAILLDALPGTSVRRLVVASSMSIYGEGPLSEDGDPLPVTEDTGPDLRSPYALSKYDQEQLCLILGEAYEIDTLALRLFNVYGPRQSLSNPYTGAAAIFASQLLNGQRPYLYEDGEQLRDFVAVADVARAFRLAISDQADATGCAINIGTSSPTTIAELARGLADELGLTTEPYISHRKRAGDVRHCFADASLARELLGWSPHTSFWSGLRGLAVWLAAQQADDRSAAANAELHKRGLLGEPA